MGIIWTASAAPAEGPVPFCIGDFCINEICSSNGSSYILDGKTPDYIELRNLTEENLSLDGCFLSEDRNRLKRFSLEGYVIPAGSYIVLAADKKELPFKLSASDGEELYLSDGEGRILQHVTLPPLKRDTAYSLQEDGSWHVESPTPLGTNASGQPYVRKGDTAPPSFSHPAGFYGEPFDLILSCFGTDTIYYTVDGSAPDENAVLYTGPIRVENVSARPNVLSARTDVTIEDAVPPSGPVRKAVVIRAIAVSPEGKRSQEAVNTYFVGIGGGEAFQNVPVFSVIADPDSLFDEEDGIYVRGRTFADWLADEGRNTNLPPQQIPTNYRMKGREWEIAAAVQWFDADHVLRMSQGAGLRIHGNWTRERAKKSFNLYARKDYGAGSFEHNILPENDRKERLVLRANLGKDSLLHAMLAETGLPTSPTAPCMVFLNGEFWGYYEIREKQDERDIAAFYGLDEKELLVLKNSEWIAGEQPEGSGAKDGWKYYHSLISEIAALDPATDSGYAAAGERIDIENYITCMAGIAYLNNSDYGSNYTIWRTAQKGDGMYRDGKWRWIFQDLDNCCFTHAGATEMISLLPEDRLFAALWENEGFQTAFLTRIMDYANVELAADYVRDFITPVLTARDPYLKEDSKRWASGSKSAVREPGRAEIRALMAFFDGRREKVVSALTEALGVTRGTGMLSLSDLPAGIVLTVNGHRACVKKECWTGSYFSGCPVFLEVMDIPGYRFEGWYEGEKLLTANHFLEVTVEDARSLVPVYSQLPVAVAMDERNILTGTGADGFSIRMEGSNRRCLITPDASVRVMSNYTEGPIICEADPALKQAQGLTLSLPLDDRTGVGGSFTLEAEESFSWRVLCGNEEAGLKEQPVDMVTLSDGVLQLSYTVPEEWLGAERVDIRLEAEPVEKARGKIHFILQRFLVYGMQVDDSIREARAYARAARKTGAPEELIPDFRKLEALDPAEIGETVSALRQRLRSMLLREAVTAPGTLWPGVPALEGLEDQTAVIVDRNLIEAFYDVEEIAVGTLATDAVYLYEWKDGRLAARGPAVSSNRTAFLPKQEGIFLLTDRRVEDVRFSAEFAGEEISQALSDRFFSGGMPSRALWLDVTTLTSYQEEAAIKLPPDWAECHAYAYLLQGTSLVYCTEKQPSDNSLHLLPVTGKVLLLDETPESVAQRAEWDRLQAEDIRREKEAEKEKSERMKKTVILGGIALLALFAAGILINVAQRRKKK